MDYMVPISPYPNSIIKFECLNITTNLKLEDLSLPIIKKNFVMLNFLFVKINHVRKDTSMRNSLVSKRNLEFFFSRVL